MNIAIIEDSKTVGYMIFTTLRSYGYYPYHFKSYKLDEQAFDPLNFDLIIVNTNLEHSESKDLIRAIRETSTKIYILGVQTKGDWRGKVQILNCGADDVISYPFPMQEVLARIQAIIRRPRDAVTSKIKVKNMIIDPVKRVVKNQNKKVPLRKREYVLLEYLARNKNRPISRDELLDNVWDYRRRTESNTVDVHISSLRRTIGENDMISTVHGYGYQLNDSNDMQYEKYIESDPIKSDPPDAL